LEPALIPSDFTEIQKKRRSAFRLPVPAIVQMIVQMIVQTTFIVALPALPGARLRADELTQPIDQWQQRMRDEVTRRHMDAALAIVEVRLATTPADLEAHGWRGRFLSWKGRWSEGEAEYRLVLEKVPNDTEILIALADVLLWQKKYEESLHILDRAQEIAPSDPEVLTRRARVLVLLGHTTEAHSEYVAVLNSDPQSRDARTGLANLYATRHELRIGNDTDFFSYTDAAQAQSISLSSRWNQRWSTVLGTNVYQRFGQEAVKFLASASFHFTGEDSLNAGGAAANPQAVVPTREAFFEYAHGFHFENRLVPGLESSYQQHWFWYQGAHVLTLSSSNLVYLPRGWTLGLAVTGARAVFVGSAADWTPSGWTKIGFPIQRPLAGNFFYAVGSEDFSRVDQIGRFAAHTYGGGLRYKFAEKQDVTGYVSRQDRSKGQTVTSFGLSYGLRF
jgi:tetratricopeptide (TPR) repeat protein